VNADFDGADRKWLKKSKISFETVLPCIRSINCIYSLKVSLRFLVKSVSGFLENKKWICSSSSMQLLRTVFNCDKKMWAMRYLLEICL
jgi:hypothetical protein